MELIQPECFFFSDELRELRKADDNLLLKLNDCLSRSRKQPPSHPAEVVAPCKPLWQEWIKTYQTRSQWIDQCAQVRKRQSFLRCWCLTGGVIGLRNVLMRPPGYNFCAEKIVDERLQAEERNLNQSPDDMLQRNKVSELTRKVHHELQFHCGKWGAYK
jgi:hypothetical protein